MEQPCTRPHSAASSLERVAAAGEEGQSMSALRRLSATPRDEEGGRRAFVRATPVHRRRSAEPVRATPPVRRRLKRAGTVPSFAAGDVPGWVTSARRRNVASELVVESLAEQMAAAAGRDPDDCLRAETSEALHRQLIEQSQERTAEHTFSRSPSPPPQTAALSPTSELVVNALARSATGEQQSVTMQLQMEEELRREQVEDERDVFQLAQLHRHLCATVDREQCADRVVVEIQESRQVGALVWRMRQQLKQLREQREVALEEELHRLGISDRAHERRQAHAAQLQAEIRWRRGSKGVALDEGATRLAIRREEDDWRAAVLKAVDCALAASPPRAAVRCASSGVSLLPLLSAHHRRHSPLPPPRSSPPRGRLRAMCHRSGALAAARSAASVDAARRLPGAGSWAHLLRLHRSDLPQLGGTVKSVCGDCDAVDTKPPVGDQPALWGSGRCSSAAHRRSPHRTAPAAARMRPRPQRIRAGSAAVRPRPVSTAVGMLDWAHAPV